MPFAYCNALVREYFIFKPIVELREVIHEISVFSYLLTILLAIGGALSGKIMQPFSKPVSTRQILSKSLLPENSLEAESFVNKILSQFF